MAREENSERRKLEETMHLLIAIMLTVTAQPPNPAVQVATAALAGRWGPLPAWKAEGYRAIIAHPPEARLAWLTRYSDYECSTHTSSGREVESGRTAAMLDVPFGTYVLAEYPDGMRLLQVWDRGSRANLRRARARGAETWCDRYIHTRNRRLLNASSVGRVWVTKGVAR